MEIDNVVLLQTVGSIIGIALIMAGFLGAERMRKKDSVMLNQRAKPQYIDLDIEFAGRRCAVCVSEYSNHRVCLILRRPFRMERFPFMKIKRGAISPMKEDSPSEM